jgi:hypothetical protein
MPRPAPATDQASNGRDIKIICISSSPRNAHSVRKPIQEEATPIQASKFQQFYFRDKNAIIKKNADSATATKSLKETISKHNPQIWFCQPPPDTVCRQAEVDKIAQKNAIVKTYDR